MGKYFKCIFKAFKIGNVIYEWYKSDMSDFGIDSIILFMKKNKNILAIFQKFATIQRP